MFGIAAYVWSNLKRTLVMEYNLFLIYANSSWLTSGVAIKDLPQFLRLISIACSDSCTHGIFVLEYVTALIVSQTSSSPKN